MTNAGSMVVVCTSSVRVVSVLALRHPVAARTERRSPALLALVFGAFLAVVGVTASAQTMLVSAHLSGAWLQSVVGDDTSLVRILVSGTLTQADLAATPSTARRAEVEAQLAAIVTRGGMLRVEVRSPGAAPLFSSDGQSRPEVAGTDFARAASGSSAASIVPAPDAAYRTAQILVEQLPVISDGSVVAVVVIARDAVPILQGIEAMRREIILVTLTGAVVVAVMLYLVFRSAHRRLGRQTRALVEATRHDPLTGSLNHGALVTELAMHVEAARVEGKGVAIALVDIDGFRLLNDTHGHAAGDRALLEVGARLTELSPAGSIVGRYGPDEFLMIAPGTDAGAVEPPLDRFRDALMEVSLQFEGGEQLPITVSAGICAYPTDAESVTELLAVGARTVGEAKASGGDAIRVARPDTANRAIVKTFDVLRGLVNAIDTKDRYTRRHSEDVARYADLIASQIGADPELRRAVRTAALLHDVGKIGIPDELLRKPAKLTAEEFEAFKQHVTLGGLIVHGLPDMELVRAGVRYHHERWDGSGYGEGLGGEEIPQIARILAVADTYSAMTTTRPYRKALDADEALRRLTDAAGSQLDPDLVRVFIDAITGAEQLEEPEAVGWRARIWAPIDQVA